MKAQFWHERWESDQLGWHQDAPGELLVHTWTELELASTVPVFVPLCGKSLDMRWLRDRGHPIVGVELSPIACRDFFAEAGVRVEPRTEGAFDVFEADGFRLLCGDFFDLTADDVADVAGVYDRGSLIALPPEMRRRYAAHATAILPASVRILLLSVEYDPSRMDGPPHSVNRDEIETLFGGDFAIRLLHASEPAAPPPRFVERGLDAMRDTAWLLERTPGAASAGMGR